MTIKLQYPSHRGGETVSLVEYVKHEVRGHIWHGDGELETIRSELESTREFLERLIIVMAETMTREQIARVLDLEYSNGTRIVED